MSDQDLSMSEVIKLTAEIVSAHVGNNAVPPSDVPVLIKAVHEALLETLDSAGQDEPELVPAVPIKRSVQRDYLICLEDGRKHKMLKRHLASAHGMTPDEYREKWGLGKDYPMVAPSYAEQRSELARRIGLGRTSKSRTPQKQQNKRRTTRRTRRTASAAAA